MSPEQPQSLLDCDGYFSARHSNSSAAALDVKMPNQSVVQVGIKSQEPALRR